MGENKKIREKDPSITKVKGQIRIFNSMLFNTFKKLDLFFTLIHKSGESVLRFQTSIWTIKKVRRMKVQRLSQLLTPINLVTP